MFVVGLTGGIGSGKSAAASAFAELGIEVIDADQIARDVVAAGTEGLAALTQAFGATILAPDGTLNRALLRQLAFSDDSIRLRLNALMHPRIASRTRELFHAASGPYLIWMVPLLLENALWKQAARILVVDLPEADQKIRAAHRDNVGLAQIEAIMRSQMDRLTRLRMADDILDNSCTMEDLKRQVALLDDKYRVLARNA